MDNTSNSVEGCGSDSTNTSTEQQQHTTNETRKSTTISIKTLSPKPSPAEKKATNPAENGQIKMKRSHHHDMHERGQSCSSRHKHDSSPTSNTMSNSADSSCRERGDNSNSRDRDGDRDRDRDTETDESNISTGVSKAAGLRESDLKALENSLQLYYQSTSRYDSVSETSVQEATRPDGTVVIPCKAKTIFPDHNEQTAYFELPNDIKHGQELSCSHEGCRQSANQFLYCLHCGIPVDAQSFWKGHRHESISSTLCQKPAASFSAVSLPSHASDPNKSRTDTTGDNDATTESTTVTSGTVSSPSIAAVASKPTFPVASAENTKATAAGRQEQNDATDHNKPKGRAKRGGSSEENGFPVDQNTGKMSSLSSQQASSSQTASSSESVLSSSSRGTSSHTSSGNTNSSGDAHLGTIAANARSTESGESGTNAAAGPVAGNKRKKLSSGKRSEYSPFHHDNEDDDEGDDNEDDDDDECVGGRGAKKLRSRKRPRDMHSERMFGWAVLLERRPEDDSPEELSAWLVDVLKVSNPRQAANDGSSSHCRSSGSDSLIVYNSASPSFSEHDSTSASSNATENPNSDYSSPNPNENHHSESSMETDANGSSRENGSSGDESSSKYSNSERAKGILS